MIQIIYFTLQLNCTKIGYFSKYIYSVKYLYVLYGQNQLTSMKHSNLESLTLFTKVHLILVEYFSEIEIISAVLGANTM